MSNSLPPHGLQHTRLPCASLSPRVCSNSHPLNQWCYLTILSFATLFSFCLQSFPASGSFPMSRLFASGDQSTGASASASVLPMNIQDWFPLGWAGFISLQSKGLSRGFSSTTIQKHQFFSTQTSLYSLTSVHDYWKNHSVQFSSVQLLSRVRLFATPWITAGQASLSITNSWSSLKLMSIEWVMSSSRLILCRPLLLLPPIPPSIGVFSSESTLRMRWPKYWSFNFNISPSNEHPGLISFRIDWLDLLAELWLYEFSSAKWCLWFLIYCLGLSFFFPQSASIFNFMAAVNICNDFGAQENWKL